MSTRSRQSARRRELLEALTLAGREHSNAIVMFHTAVAHRLGLGATDEKILDLLQREGPLSAGDLCEQTGLAPSSITGALDRLERNRFVSRHRDPADQRRVTVQLRTERLAEAMSLFAGLIERLDQLYAGYTDDELATILDFMRGSAELQRAATHELTEGRCVRPEARAQKTRKGG